MSTGPAGWSHAATQPRRPGHLRDRPGMHGAVPGVRAGRRRGVGPGHPPGPRPRREHAGHRDELRPGAQRAADRPGAARPAGPGADRHQVRHRPRRRTGCAWTAGPSTSAATARRRCGASDATSSTCTTCTGSIRTCRWRTPWARWPRWWPRARSATSGCPRPPRPSWSRPRRCIRSARWSSSGRCCGATRRTTWCRPPGGWASAWCPTARSAAACSPPPSAAADIDGSDFRRADPRFHGPALDRNLASGRGAARPGRRARAHPGPARPGLAARPGPGRRPHPGQPPPGPHRGERRRGGGPAQRGRPGAARPARCPAPAGRGTGTRSRPGDDRSRATEPQASRGPRAVKHEVARAGGRNSGSLRRLQLEADPGPEAVRLLGHPAAAATASAAASRVPAAGMPARSKSVTSMSAAAAGEDAAFSARDVLGPDVVERQDRRQLGLQVRGRITPVTYRPAAASSRSSQPPPSLRTRGPP